MNRAKNALRSIMAAAKFLTRFPSYRKHFFATRAEYRDAFLLAFAIAIGIYFVLRKSIALSLFVGAALGLLTAANVWYIRDYNRHAAESADDRIPREVDGARQD